MSRGQWRRPNAPRVSTILLAAMAVVAAIAVGFALWTAPAPPQGRAGSDAFRRFSLPSLPTTQPSALYIGDSYTMGPGTYDLGYACLTSTNMGWQCNISAQPGTGYLAGGPGARWNRIVGALDEDSTNLSERMPRIRDLYRADVVFLDAGRNDIQFDMVYVRTMFEYTVRRAMEAWPNSRIVVIAPWFIWEPAIRPLGLEGRTIGDEFESVLRSSPDFDAVLLIDPAKLNWFANVDVSPYLSEDHNHPNIAGNKQITELLTAALTEYGLARTA